MTNLRKPYEKVWLAKNLGWSCDCQKSLKNLMKNLCDDITGHLQKRKIRGKWCHSGNPLSEAVIGRIFWAKNNWQPERRFPKNAFEKWLINFLRKSQEVVSRWLTKDLRKSYDELRKNLTKILRSFENRVLYPNSANRSRFTNSQC